ncbi:MAG: hypothetical protein K2K93_05145, partial [Muribaculaceae bacterium]|nr:hypothetical protein [Muribaculaceae bacterium]
APNFPDKETRLTPILFTPAARPENHSRISPPYLFAAAIPLDFSEKVRVIPLDFSGKVRVIPLDFSEIYS